MNIIQQFFINLFKPIWLREYSSGDWIKFELKQLDAVNALRDPMKLQLAAFEAPEWYIREAAVEKIDDPEILKTVALNAEHAGVRTAAVKKITDPEVLKTVVLNDKDPVACLAAVEKIDDPEVLKTVALNADKDIRLMATHKLFETAPMDAAEPMVELLTSEKLDEQDFQFLTESLRFLYAKSDDQGLKDKIQRSQKRYDVRTHSDNCGYSERFISSYNFTLDENASKGTTS